MHNQILTFTLSLMLLAGCGEAAWSPDLPFAAQERGGTPWRLGVFTSADNDLDEGLTVASSLTRFARRFPNVAAANLYDGRKKDDGLITFQSAGGGEFYEEPIGEIDSGSAKEVRRFLDFMRDNLPAQRTVLSLADHGGGAVRGLLSDEPEDSAIYLKDMERLFEARPTDIVLFDACHMSMIEVAYALVGNVTAMVGAPTTTEGDMPYVAIMETLHNTAGRSTQQVARAIGDTLVRRMNYEVAIGAIDVTQVPRVADAFTELTQVMTVKLPRLHQAFKQAFLAAQPYALETDAHYLLYNDYRDMVDLLDRLSTIRDPELRDAVRAVKQALKPAILMHGHHNGRKLKMDQSHGLAIYAPVAGVEENYSNSQWGKVTGWGRFLARLASTGSELDTLGVFRDPFPKAVPNKQAGPTD